MPHAVKLLVKRSRSSQRFTRRSRKFSGGKTRRQNPTKQNPGHGVMPWPVVPVTARA
jgi:hypothetical protein